MRDILRWPDPRLAEVCAPVGAITAEVELLAQDLLDTMYAARGRGLAAPQVGEMQRLFVMDAGWKEGAPDPMVFIDPVLKEKSAERVTQEEGCLSIPGVTMDVARPARVRMAWTDLDGTRQERSFEGFAAVCVQHELDHLDGIVTFDRLDTDTRRAKLAAYAGA